MSSINKKMHIEPILKTYWFPNYVGVIDEQKNVPNAKVKDNIYFSYSYQK